MVQKLLGLLNRRLQGLHEAAFLLACSALASQLLGLFRDRLLSHEFGAGATLDIYYAAFKLPDLIFGTVASLVAVTVLIPYLIHHMESGDAEKARRFFSSITTIFLLVVGTVSLIAFFLLPYLTKFIAPGFPPEAFPKLIGLSRILLLSPILLGMSNLLGSITQTFKKFIVYALTPIFYNLGIIIGILFFYPRFGLAGLAWGVVLGALLHMSIQIPAILESGFVPRITFDIDWVSVKSVMMTSLPRTLTLSAQQLVIIVLTAIASFMAPGSIALFNLSFNLQSVPLAIIGISYSVAAFPALSYMFSSGDKEKFVRYMVTAGRHILFWSLPITALFLILRAHIVRIILGSGNFNWDHTRLAAASLGLFAISAAAQALVQLFIRGYYASGRTKIPLVINLSASGLTVALAAIFALSTHFTTVGVLAGIILRARVPGVEMLALPLAFSIGSICNAIAFCYFFAKHFSLPEGLGKAFAQALFGALLVGGSSWVALRFFGSQIPLDTLLRVIVQTFVSALTGIIVGGLFFYLSGNEEFKEISLAIRRRVMKDTPILPDQTDVQGAHSA